MLAEKVREKLRERRPPLGILSRTADTIAGQTTNGINSAI